ncbi:unnamed protein product [Urochloa humidicola]
MQTLTTARSCRCRSPSARSDVVRQHGGCSAGPHSGPAQRSDLVLQHGDCSAGRKVFDAMLKSMVIWLMRRLCFTHIKQQAYYSQDHPEYSQRATRSQDQKDKQCASQDGGEQLAPPSQTELGHHML